jgi:hypothetical protein
VATEGPYWFCGPGWGGDTDGWFVLRQGTAEPICRCAGREAAREIAGALNSAFRVEAARARARGLEDQLRAARDAFLRGELGRAVDMVREALQDIAGA